MPPTPGKPPARLLAAGAEVFLAFLAAVLASNWVVTGVLQPASEWAGAASVAAVLAVVLAYSSRFRPTGEGFLIDAAAGGRALLRGMRLSGHACVWTLVAFHAGQLLLLWILADSRTPLLRCMDLYGLLWSPCYEELLARWLLFYVALHRSGGNLLFAVFACALVFGAMHLSNALLPGTSSALTWLQIALGLLSGLTFGALFARTGSIASVILVHAANNVVAYAWMAVETAAGDVPLDEMEDAGVPLKVSACGPPSISSSLLASLACHATVLVACAVLALRETLVELGQGGRRFRATHHLVYALPDAR